jgi:hypothetical protein
VGSGGPDRPAADAEINDDLERQGDGFLVRSTVHEIEADLDPMLNWRQFEQDLDRERDDPDYDR